MKHLVKICLFGFCCSLSAYCTIWGGPEVYHLKRNRDSGVYQSGTLAGGRFGIERYKRWGFYLGGDVLFADGNLHGKHPVNGSSPSYLQELQYEGRIGYQLSCGGFSVIPVVGMGYFHSINDFCPIIKTYQGSDKKKIIDLIFRTRFGFTLVGILSEFRWSCWSIGANVKVRFPFDSRNQIIVPNFQDTQFMGEEPHYVIDVPISFQSGCFGLSVVPFYRFRHYGAWEGRRNFFGTKFRIWGARVLFVIKW